MTPAAVVFDIGKVLFDWDPVGFYDRTIGAHRRRALFAQVDLWAMNAAIDLGAPLRRTVRDTADAHPDWRREIAMWCDNWLDFTADTMPRSARLLRALRSGGVPVLALSNFGIETFDLAAATRYPVLREFDRAYVSGRLGVKKPDPRIYEIVERDCGLAADMLIFTDDRPENIAAARARGWRTHRFDGPDGWAARLVAEGLLSEEQAT